MIFRLPFISEQGKSTCLNFEYNLFCKVRINSAKLVNFCY
jgi:hypothetical protein